MKETINNKVLLVQVDYNKYLAVPLIMSHLLDEIRIVKEVNSGAYEEVEEDGEIKIISSSKLSKAAVEEAAKKEAAQYRDWWLDEEKKVKEMKKELDSLKQVKAAVDAITDI